MRHALRPILLSSSALTAGIVLHGAALALLARLVGDMQREGRLTRFPGLDALHVNLPPPSALTATGVFIALFTLGSLLGYLGRSTAIRLESALYRHFTDAILAQLAPSGADEERFVGDLYRRHTLGTRHELLKILLSDCRFPGVVVRLSLFNIGHLGSMALGLAVLAYHAPLLLPLVAAFGMLALGVLYPLSLAATRSTRDLENLGAQRSAYIRSRLGEALSGRPFETSLGFVEDEAEAGFDVVHALRQAPAEEPGSALDDYLRALERRLRVTEVSRALMSSMMAAGIGTLTWLLFTGKLEQVSSASSLLVLLFGMRFVLTGIEGGMVALTAINRYLPHLMRLYALARDLDSETVPVTVPISFSSGSYLAGRIHDERHPLPIRPRWRLETPQLQTVEGVLAPGQVFHLTGPGLDCEIGLDLFRALLQDAATGEPDAVTRLRAAQAAMPKYRTILDAVPNAREWVAALVSEGMFDIDAETVQLIAELRSPLPQRQAEIVRFAIRCLHQSRCDLPLVAVDQRLLRQLNEAGQQRLLALFGHCTVLLVDRDSARAIECPRGDLLLVANGARIVCAVPRLDHQALRAVVLGSIIRGEWPAGPAARS